MFGPSWWWLFKPRLWVSSKSKALLTAMMTVLWLQGVSWIHEDEHDIPHHEVWYVPLGRTQFPKHGFLGMFCGTCSTAAPEEEALINLMSYPPATSGCAGYSKTSQMALGPCIEGSEAFFSILSTCPLRKDTLEKTDLPLAREWPGCCKQLPYLLMNSALRGPKSEMRWSHISFLSIPWVP